MIAILVFAGIIALAGLIFGDSWERSGLNDTDLWEDEENDR